MKKELLDVFLKKLQGGIRVVYWDNEERTYNNNPKITIRFLKEPPLISLDDPLLTLGDLYIEEYFDIEGTIEDLMELLETNKNIFRPQKKNTFMTTLNTTLGIGKSKEKDMKNIQKHYDLGNDFFSLWLDSSMCYSCAYFKTPTDSLEQAQRNKISHSLKKLNLQKGEKLLDIGCGWGELLFEAATKYGVYVTGITLSQEQFSHIKEQIELRNLFEKVEVRLESYEELDPKKDLFDKIISIGMFEHVGQKRIPGFMKKTSSVLKRSGIFMLHTITGLEEGGQHSWMNKHIFPGGYIPTVREIINILPDYDFRVLHVESLRRHYARTLEYWSKNYETHKDEIEKKFGRTFLRMWDIYLKGCAASFKLGFIDIHQFTLSLGINNDYPETFEFLYKD
ncbi:cyclopropane-fatty-acyl-phospholipid synthase [Thermodesulfobium acidiphilum]|uniref:Cyclopropane-fatty-acyl-phospholipid synthase n=1 Tax=Thermodesulfobium acidiphilum TaxID=1794699 RepID=A0A2R4VYC8_THEAF|nr:cyclopropane-fatty-acyl-phospholipid synthase family protein [Thermodesulfobium acidiphilum]AWB09456.1 cyclopropane-fatty-acyl-phospholipid synthase [Thermodesulfobium acidiphilum]